MTTLARANSFTWNNDFDLQNLKIAISEMDEDNEYMCPMWQMSIANEEVKISGDLACSHGNYKVSMTPKAGGETIMIDGKYLSIEERQADGSWKIIRSCFNDNAPLKEA